jgi:hypothetical protein
VEIVRTSVREAIDAERQAAAPGAAHSDRRP